MAKTKGLDLLDRPIFTWSPMQEGMPYLAKIRSFEMFFRGDTAMKAMRAANDFRLIEAHKLRGDDKFPDEHREALQAALERVKK